MKIIEVNLLSNFLIYNNNTPTFQGFLLANNNNEQFKGNMYSTCINGQKILDAERANQTSLENGLHSTYTSGQKVLDIERAKQSSPSCKRRRKVDNAETIPSIAIVLCAKDATQKTGTGYIIKLSAKAEDA